MTTLDDRLYAWLLATDERRFVLAFNAYFSVAYPSVLRFLARISGWDASLLEEAAQDALLKFFERAGRDRRTDSESVRVAIAALRPLPIGPLHERQVLGWLADVSSFRCESASFGAQQLRDGEDPDWKSATRALADRIPPLARRGRCLIDAVRVHVRWPVDEPASPSLTSTDSTPDSHDENISAATDRLVEQFTRDVSACTQIALAMETRLTGLVQFVSGASTIVAMLPRLRVPTNGYLFEIANTTFLDVCKHQKRLKRAARATAARTGDGALDSLRGDSNHAVERLEPEFGRESSTEALAHEPTRPDVLVTSTELADTAAHDPISQFEDRQFFERFCEHLRTPVDRAADSYRAALLTGNGDAERRKLQSVSSKLSRTFDVLSMIGEGFTQEYTAEHLSLSRNQVKYVIEVVQDAYAQFVASTDRSAASSRMPGVFSHAH